MCWESQQARGFSQEGGSEFLNQGFSPEETKPTALGSTELQPINAVFCLALQKEYSKNTPWSLRESGSTEQRNSCYAWKRLARQLTLHYMFVMLDHCYMCPERCTIPQPFRDNQVSTLSGSRKGCETTANTCRFGRWWETLLGEEEKTYGSTGKVVVSLGLSTCRITEWLRLEATKVWGGVNFLRSS